jgi:predicted ester cyclase
MAAYVVIENTPGYLPDADEPATFEEYSEAVAYLNERAAEYADDPDGSYRVEYGWASGDNLAAVMVYDDEKTHDLGRWIAVEIDYSDTDEL